MRLRFSAFFSLAAFLLGCALGLHQPGAVAQEPGSLYGIHGVSPDAVRQGVLGSCYFHASIAAIAKADPDTLRAAIGHSVLGGYKVHFTSGPDEVVFPDDIKYGRAHSYDHSEGDWVLVLMRAYAQRTVRKSLEAAVERSTLIPGLAKPVALRWLDESGFLLVGYDRAIRSVVTQDGMMDKAMLERELASQLSSVGISATESRMLLGFLDEKGFFDSLSRTVQENGEVFGAYKSVGQGGIPFRVIESFLGSAHVGEAAESGPLVEQLRRLHAGGLAMVAGTWARPPNPELPMSNWWIGSHCYSIMDYDESTQTVRLRNPWGTKPDPNGVFNLPLAVFAESYQQYTYSVTPGN
jgi:hypothetical protein